MDANELKEHRVRAAANLEKVQMLFRRGRASQEELNQAKQALDGLVNQTPVPEKITPKQAKQAEKERFEPERTQIRPEAAALITQIQQEQAEIDIEKRKLSNQLALVPKVKPCRELVDRILLLRDAWTAKRDEIKYAMQFGKRPETQAEQESEFNQDAFTASLPKDALRLDQMIRNERSNISKYKNKLQSAKTPAKQIHYETMIAQAQIRINAMETQIAALK